MKTAEDMLDKIDDFFSAKKESDKWLLMLSVVAIILFPAYMYLLPYAQSSYQNRSAKRYYLEKSLRERKTYLNSIKNDTIGKYDEDIRGREQQIIVLTKKINGIDSGLGTLSNIYFNQKNWSEFLNTIAENAKLNDIELRFIRNRQFNTEEDFREVLELEMRSYGKFGDLVKFIYLLEHNTLIAELYSSSFDGEGDRVYADINLSVWGISQ
jgi:hypothetical protein